tara:strand:+ start:2029 stop:2208 length:180 start_codon:yes stop_codon:yes gene_type:complete
MKVHELIKALQKCDPELQIFAFLDDSIHPLDFVDDTISDRVDINIGQMTYVMGKKKRKK